MAFPLSVCLIVSVLNHHFGRIFPLVLEFKLAVICFQHFNNVISLSLSLIISSLSLTIKVIDAFF